MRSLGATAGVMEWWGQCLVEWAQKRNKGEIVPESPLPWSSAEKMRQRNEAVPGGGGGAKRGVFPSGKKALCL